MQMPLMDLWTYVISCSYTVLLYWGHAVLKPVRSKTDLPKAKVFSRKRVIRQKHDLRNTAVADFLERAGHSDHAACMLKLKTVYYILILKQIVEKCLQ